MTCMMTRSRLLSTLIVLSVFVTANGFSEETVQSGYPVVDTGQSLCYDTHQHITPPGVGDAFFGQDAQYQGQQVLATKNVQWQITVCFVITMEKFTFLVTMQRIIGSINIKNDLFWCGRV